MGGSTWGVTPRDHIRSECVRRGREAVIADCLALLDGATDPELTRSLTGPGMEKYLDGEEHADTYWFRVWALRGLLWAWDDRATGAVRRAMADESWRVREMAAKVAARNLVGDATPELAGLSDDPVPRVRSAAERALTRISASDA